MFFSVLHFNLIFAFLPAGVPMFGRVSSKFRFPIQLLDAVCKGQVDIVKGFLQDSKYIRNEDPVGAFISPFIDSSHYIREQDEKGETLLIKACKNGDIEMVKFLLSFAQNIDTMDFCGETALTKACDDSGNYDLVRLLIGAGARVNPKQHPGLPFYSTPLICACKRGDLKLATLLINSGAKKYSCSYCSHGQTN